MYKPSIYLDVRVLLSAVPSVFTTDSDSNAAKDILTAKKEFQKRNNSAKEIHSATVQASVMHKVSSLVNALGGKISRKSVLERLAADMSEPPDDKNFKGLSIKVASGGSLDIMFHKKPKKITVEEYRVEENYGHLTRSGGKVHMDWTYAGCPCLRLRTSPSFEVGEEAEIFLNELYTLMNYQNLLTSLGESSIRCNAYVALSDYPEKPLYEVKIRNLNSFNFVRKAINSELTRQENLLGSGGSAKSESRLWIEEKNSTEPWQERNIGRLKFKKISPEVTVDFSDYQSAEVVTELPAQRRHRLQREYGLSRLRSEFICGEKSRADYFEKAVKLGSSPLLTARWMAGELMKLLNAHRQSISQSRLTAEKFSGIMRLLDSGKIHSGIAKDLMQRIFRTGEDLNEIIMEEKCTLLSTREELLPLVEKILGENPGSVTNLKNGDMAPLEYLTGQVMRESGGRAVPEKVKALIKEKLRISVVYVFSMGGAISAKKEADGTISAGHAESIKNLLEGDNGTFPVQITPVCTMLSEETEPKDWAALIESVKLRIESGTANGIVITHGTDTLPYTAALIFWLFSKSPVPIVLTSSVDLPWESDEAKSNLNLAIRTAREKESGVYVAYDGKLLSPLNLKYLGQKGESFQNWNMEKKTFSADTSLSSQFLSVDSPDRKVMTELLNEASSRLALVRLYPGLPGNRYGGIIGVESDVDSVILELYSSGTGNMRNSDYSLKNFLLDGRKRQVHFYCTSQQESAVDFSTYATSAELWRNGGVPMGMLTTESTVALFFASSLIADSDDELHSLMESGGELRVES